MTNDIYKKLREQLDQYSIGYPATQSGVEIKILKKLFTEEEAEFFLLLSLSVETPEAVAKRTGRDLEATTALLKQMAEKGLIFKLGRDDQAKYAAVPYVAGSYEFSLGNMDRELAQLMDDYLEEALCKSITDVTPFMRPIPINRSVDVSYNVATYEDSRKIVAGQKLIAVADCICRVQQGKIDKGCGKPLEVCFLFGSHGRYYIDHGMARQISAEEAYKILEKAEEAGLVTQPFTTQNPGGMCNCCGDCCAILRALNKLPNPAELVVSNYYAVVDAESCVACETCLERCQMGAISINEDEAAQVNLDRCIGCGLCVTTCPSEALRLEIKPEDHRRYPPETGMQQVMEIARQRGTSPIPLTK
ncbi:MAG: 4Fe-4S binding protein [Thermodesulfobacteriota bacterium]|nr:4Fe-4S binding protein [Thermodesulfobacteriota bacterium]